MKKLFTERHGQAPPRIAETLDSTTRSALLNLVSARIDDEWFGLDFSNKLTAMRMRVRISRNCGIG